MRKRLFSLAILAVLTLGFAYPAIAPAASPEPHPEIRAAIQSLHKAKDHLEHAAHDFGGHRVEAIKACNEALEQLQQALQFDK